MSIINLTKLFFQMSFVSIIAGCSSSSVDEAITELEKFELTNVYAANGTTQSIEVSLDAAGIDTLDNETIPSFGNIILLSLFEKPDNYNLSYTINSAEKGTTTIAKNSQILYAATECGGKEFIQHDLNDNNNIYIMNLTDTTLVPGILDISKDAVTVTMPDASPCSTTAFTSGSIIGDWAVNLNGSNIENLTINSTIMVLTVYNVTASNEAANLTSIDK